MSSEVRSETKESRFNNEPKANKAISKDWMEKIGVNQESQTKNSRLRMKNEEREMSDEE